mmetsp:Transcript_46101/g.108184  ORF Transcript_46101/g.108184 Transcript_46101/m.108184 type:complete len:468 (+) Transcript_46101:114-1517(+)
MAGQAAKQPTENKEVQKLRKKAEEGDADAQNKMGDLYWDGMHGVERSHEEAMTWFAKSAEQGNTDAEYSMGFAYLSGQGVERDMEQGAIWLTKAADKGHAKSMRQMAQLLFSGMGVEQDTAEAVKYWTKAAEAGDILAMGILGKLYGVGVPGIAQDLGKAFGYLTKAAEGRDPDSMHLLGEAYEKGLGVEADEKQAMVWYARAEAMGYVSADSYHNKGIMFYKEKKMEQAAKCFLSAARARHPVACSNIARFYYWGRGVEQDYHMALHWANEAVKLGESDAAQVVGMCHEYGHGTPADHQLAQQWYLYCIQGTTEQNMEAACMDALGRCAYKGSHHDYVHNKVPEDYSQAAYWWGRAAELGVKDAQNRLAKLHARGRGVKKDMVKAKLLWSKAATLGSEEAAEALKEHFGGYTIKERLEVYLPTLVVMLLLLAICFYFGVQYHEMSQESWFVKSSSDHAAEDTPPAS